MIHLISVEIEKDVAERLVQILGNELEMYSDREGAEELNVLQVALAEALENDDG